MTVEQGTCCKGAISLCSILPHFEETTIEAVFFCLPPRSRKPHESSPQRHELPASVVLGAQALLVGPHTRYRLRGHLANTRLLDAPLAQPRSSLVQPVHTRLPHAAEPRTAYPT